MSTVKMLPWLAQVSGIEVDHAAQLWQSASAHAQGITGEIAGIRFLDVAHQRMVLLVEQEILAANPVEQTPWLMVQAHLSVVPLVVANLLAEVFAAIRSVIGLLRRHPRNVKTHHGSNRPARCCSPSSSRCVRSGHQFRACCA